MAARSALPTSALSSLEAMLHSLMRGAGGGDDDEDTPIDDTRASPPPPLPARPTPRGRHPSQPRLRVRVPAAGPWEPPPLPPSSSRPSPSPIEELEDAMTTTEDDDSAVVVEELQRKAVEVEARLRDKEEENAALKRRIESYHIRWLEYEIMIKSMEEAFHEQMAALQSMQMAQDAARMAEGTAYDRRGSSESPAEEPPPVRLWHGRDRMSSSVGARPRGAVGRLGSEFRRQSRTLERAVEPPPPPGPPQPIAISGDDLKKLKAQFRAWAKEYKARLRRAQAEIDRNRRRRGGSCWI